VISVLYAQELISFICIAGSFQVGEIKATAGVLYGCEVLLGTHHIYRSEYLISSLLSLVIYGYDYAA
jgi:hypothetical protein